MPCDNTTDVSRIQVVGDLLGLHVLIDGQPADPDNDGIVVVAPGEHHWAVLDSEDTVIAEGDINVPSCFAAAPVLGITKSNDAPLVDGNPTANEGDTVTYTLDYTLTDGPVTNGVITDVLPTGTTYITDSATDGGDFTFTSYDSTTRTLTWSAATATLASGSVTYQATIDAGAAKLEQPLTNTACIDSDTTDTQVCATSNVFVPAPPAGETFVPTPPPTDAAAPTDSNSSGGSMLFILLGLTGLGLALVFVAPTPAAIRKRR